MAIAIWITEFRDTYFANATSRRDFRVQMRGSRSAILFGCYLSALVAVATIYYSSSNNGQVQSVVEAQRALTEFYATMMRVLAVLVVLITPALSASTVAAERARQSLDLIFSAPVSPRYYLVGKVISSYRYTWMLLILALPITAAAVVLGGAAWADVLNAYLLLSFHALLFTTFALLMSSIAPKPVSAIVWSYVGVGLYSIFTAAFTGSSVFGRGATDELPTFATFSPFFVSETASSYSLIAGVNVPNWILTGLLVLAACKFMLLGAAVRLEPGQPKHVRSLRSHALVYCFALAVLYGFSAGTAGLFGMTAPSPLEVGSNTFAMGLVMLLFLPGIVTYGFDDGRRHYPDGVFKFRKMLTAQPSGSLPFLLAFFGLSIVGTLVGQAAIGKPPSPDILPWVVFGLGFWTMFWAFGRLASSALLGVKSAKSVLTGIIFTLVMLPIGIIPALQTALGIEWPANLWMFWIVGPITDPKKYGITPVLYGGGYLLLATFILIAAEASLKKRMLRARLPHGYSATT